MSPIENIANQYGNRGGDGLGRAQLLHRSAQRPALFHLLNRRAAPVPQRRVQPGPQPRELLHRRFVDGGYGALKTALHFPERFNAAMILSGVLCAGKYCACTPTRAKRRIHPPVLGLDITARQPARPGRVAQERRRQPARPARAC